MSKAGDERRWRRPLIRLRYRLSFWLAITVAISAQVIAYKLNAENKRLKHVIWVLKNQSSFVK